jgi:hypothetical protein
MLSSPRQIVETFSVALARDHDELAQLSSILITLDPRSVEWRTALTRARQVLLAHTNAERHALHNGIARSVMTGPLARSIALVEDQHREQLRLLDALAEQRELVVGLDFRTELLSHVFDEKFLLLAPLLELLGDWELAELGALYATGVSARPRPVPLTVR